MIQGYSRNLSVQYLIALLKAHGIRKCICSPGSTNLEFSAGLQYDGSFELYSAVDERGAAYMACGMAEESGEPVVISCTESTASRNYAPGLTEAFYRKLPVLAVTGIHRYSRIGHLFPQLIDRSKSPDDVFTLKVHLPVIKDAEDAQETELLINRAILNLKRRGGGPVHIDLPCCDNNFSFDVKQLPDVRVIHRYDSDTEFPHLPDGKIAVFLGSHHRFSSEEIDELDTFCAANNAVVFCDPSSGYAGSYAVHAGLLARQNKNYEIFSDIVLLIHLGEAAADEPVIEKLKKSVRYVWRVSPDGELRDTFGKLAAVFEMRESTFFRHFYEVEECERNPSSYFTSCMNLKNSLRIPYDTLPLSNVYVAARIAPLLPENSFIHLGVSDTIRAWTLFDFPASVVSVSNMGCRGIDGALSSFLGASFTDKKRLCFCVLGDLSFFYDMNALGNRDIGNNIRILLINNNGGGVFKLEGAPGHVFFGDEETDRFVAAAGHWGGKSGTAVKAYVESLGFSYMCAASKEEFDKQFMEFLKPEFVRPVLFEVFTKDVDEREAFRRISLLDVSVSGSAKEAVKRILGEKGVAAAKKLLKQ